MSNELVSFDYNHTNMDGLVISPSFLHMDWFVFPFCCFFRLLLEGRVRGKK